MSVSRFKLIFFSPQNYTQGILDHLFATLPEELGRLGKYDHCAFITPGTGQFRPQPGAKPTIGTSEELSHVDEDKVEVVVNDKGHGDEVRCAIWELKEVHPYEEVAYEVYKLEDF